MDKLQMNSHIIVSWLLLREFDETKTYYSITAIVMLVSDIAIAFNKYRAGGIGAQSTNDFYLDEPAKIQLGMQIRAITTTW